MPKKTLRATALETLQQLVRMKSADDNGFCQCVSCKKMVHWKECDGGHFIPKGSSSYWALEECNVWPQCKGCNGFGMKFGSAESEYTLWMIDYYGRDFVDEMHAKKKSPRKYYAADYREMIDDWKAQIKTHKNRLGC
jgi:hypothetical protein